MNRWNDNSYLVQKKNLLLLWFAPKATDEQSSHAKDMHEIRMQIVERDSALLPLNIMEVCPKFGVLGSPTDWNIHQMGEITKFGCTIF